MMGSIYFVLGVFIFLVTVTLHEYCHGFLADKLGDPTARDAGRLTLNPLRHIDPFWTVLFPVLLFISTSGQFVMGMARPVPVNFMNLRNPRRDMIWVAVAGPLANFLLAGVLAFLFRVAGTYGHLTLQTFLLYAVYFNLGLAIFNLIPIPPLDGSRIVTGLLPFSLATRYLLLEPFGFLIVLLFYFTGLLHALVLPGIRFFCKILGVPILNF